MAPTILTGLGFGPVEERLMQMTDVYLAHCKRISRRLVSARCESAKTFARHISFTLRSYPSCIDRCD